MRTTKSKVLAKFPDATIRRCQSAFSNEIEHRITWDKDGKGNYKIAIGKTVINAWMNAYKLIEQY